MAHTDESLLLVVPNTGRLEPEWPDRLKGLHSLSLGREWSAEDLRQGLGSRACVPPSPTSMLSALLTYYSDSSEGDRRAREDGMVIRRATDDPETSLVLADLLFAAPSLGVVSMDERDDGVLVVRGCNRSVGMRTESHANGYRTVSLHHVVAAVNALLGHTSELRRFVPLAELAGAHLFAFRTEGQAEALFQLGLLGAPPGQLANYAWWGGSPVSTPDQTRAGRVSQPRVRAVG